MTAHAPGARSRHRRPATATDPLLAGPARTRRFLTPAEAAGLLGVTPTTVHRWMDSGYLPAARRGRRGVDASLIERGVVYELLRRRREALAWLDWQNPAPVVRRSLAKFVTAKPSEFATAGLFSPP